MKQLKTFIIILSILALAGSCKKEDVNAGKPNNETTIIKLPDAVNDITLIAVDAKPGIIEVPVLEIRRDAKTEADLQKTLVVKIAPDPTRIADYNSNNGTNFVMFTGYTLDPETPFDGQYWTVTFKPGEFVKYIKIKFDPLAIDLSQQYALSFKIALADGAQISASKKNVLAAIIIKNQYDGLYHSNGIFHHPVAGDRIINEDKYLSTAGATSVLANLGDLGGAGYQMILKVNPDNSVTISPAGATPNIDQHWGPNYYDPVTQSFHLFYSYNVAAPRKVEETITRK